MKYNRKQATASWGMMAKDWEQGIDYARLHKARVKRAQEAIRHAGLGAVLAFNFDNIRYITGTHIGEWARDKFMRYALCPVVGEPMLWIRRLRRNAFPRRGSPTTSPRRSRPCRADFPCN